VAAGLVTVAAACGGDPGKPDDVSRAPAEDRRLTALERRLTRLEDRGEQRANGLGGFGALARALPGEVGLAVADGPTGRPRVLGDLRVGKAWSTIKVPIALRLLWDARGPNGLTAAQRGQIERAITASDNEAAARLFDDLQSRHGGLGGAAAAVGGVLRKAGDRTTRVSTQGRDGFSPYGQTDWSLSAQVRLVSALSDGCVGDRASSAYVLDAMGRVRSDRWGLGAAGVPARWKGGWGPGPDGRYLVRQMGVLRAGRNRLAIAIAARPADGAFSSGQRMATRVARWVARRLPRLARPPGGC
jgi:hypothetical protein